jgi:hypothetical protein
MSSLQSLSAGWTTVDPAATEWRIIGNICVKQYQWAKGVCRLFSNISRRISLTKSAFPGPLST